MKATQRDLEMAVARMTLLKFFPSEAIARVTIMELLGEMVSTAEQLAWLVKTMINQVGVWEGPRELRAIFCTRFKPADGIEATSSTPGFRPEDSEAVVLDAHHQIKAADQRALPAPPEELSDQERADIATLQNRVNLLAQRKRGIGARPAHYEPPNYLRNL